VCGEVDLDAAVPERFHGVRAGERTDVSGVEIESPVVLGAGVEFSDGVRIDGPVVIGDGAKIGRGARIADSVLLPGVEVEPGAKLSGEIVSRPVDQPAG